jgi:hypothetical protein
VNEVDLFGSTFLVVFALGLQSQNVIGGHYIAAFLTCLVISAMNMVLYKMAPSAAWSEIGAFMAGGPFGIVVSMWAHQRVTRRKR